MLRERSQIELKKRWNDRTCDEPVYIAESVNGQGPVGFPLSDLYVTGSLWIEVKIRFVLDGDTYFDSIFEIDNVGDGTGDMGVINGSTSGVNRDQAMLVKIAKFVQLPEGMILRRFRSFVRLKSVNFSRDIVRKELQSMGVVPPSIASVEILGDREGNVFGGVSPSFRRSHLPSHLVKPTPQTVKELSENHSKFGLEGFKCVPLDVASVLGVVLAGDAIRFFKKDSNMPIESIKVRLCPFRFEYQIGSGS